MAKRLSRNQTRILNETVRRRETVAISAITLLEIALLPGDGPLRSKLSMDEVFGELEASPVFRILPRTIDHPRYETAGSGRPIR